MVYYIFSLGKGMIKPKASKKKKKKKKSLIIKASELKTKKFSTKVENKPL